LRVNNNIPIENAAANIKRMTSQLLPKTCTVRLLLVGHARIQTRSMRTLARWMGPRRALCMVSQAFSSTPLFG
jgi:hypothetical protein